MRERRREGWRDKTVHRGFLEGLMRSKGVIMHRILVCFVNSNLNFWSGDQFGTDVCFVNLNNAKLRKDRSKDDLSSSLLSDLRDIV